MNWIYGTHGLSNLDVGERNPMYGKEQSEYQKKLLVKIWRRIIQCIKKRIKLKCWVIQEALIEVKKANNKVEI